MVDVRMDDVHLSRFWAKVSKQPGDGCWLWTASRTGRQRYGGFTLYGRTRAAHRVAYEHFVGPVPDGLVLDHLCRVPACVNPAHLEPVTQRENIVVRGTGAASLTGRAGPKSHCVNGHEYTPENTKTKSGRRVCRTCWNLGKRQRRAQGHGRNAA